MSVFDTIGDSAHSLRTEGQEIRLTFKQGVPVTGQGTIEWNVPPPAHGCASGDSGVYSGIVLLLSTTPLDMSNIPQDGTVYVGDPTADFDLSTADKIGGALVVGAIYEAEKKGRGETLTTSLVVGNLSTNTPYYVAAYAADDQYRYHADGQRAYSDSYGSKDAADKPAQQTITLGSTTAGVLPSDGTGLLHGIDYEFDLVVDNSFPTGYDFRTIPFTINGINAGTYQDLVNEINKQFLLSENPAQSPLPPHTNDFYWNSTESKLYQYDGTSYTELSTIVEPTDPSVVEMGTYWHDTTTGELKRNNVPNPTGWNIIPSIRSSTDLIELQCNTYWFDDIIVRRWNSYIWLDQHTIISLTDPSICPIPECGTYWFNAGSLLYSDSENPIWQEQNAIYWPEAPNALSLNTYWFDTVAGRLFILQVSGWYDLINVEGTLIQEATPSTPNNDDIWYKPSTEELYQYDTPTLSWKAINVLESDTDPHLVATGDLWWNSSTDDLFMWDSFDNEWEQVDNFIISALDPTQPIPLTVDSVWYEPTSKQLRIWNGADWTDVEHIHNSTDPTAIATGEAWFDYVTNSWKIYGTPLAGWNVINPIDLDVDPTSIPVGTYWFDLTNTALYVRNGTTWVITTFSTVPFVPARRSQWFDMSNDTLNEWTGTTWSVVYPSVRIGINRTGGITFEMVQGGSQGVLLVPAPHGSASESSLIATGFADFTEFGANTLAEYTHTSGTSGRVYQARTISDTNFLWSNLSPAGKILAVVDGNDGKSGLPGYAQLGVGDDGTPDERRELMDSLRAQLGYPVVDVELTNYQLDTAIQSALESFRKRASNAYRRGFYFVDIEPQKQQYLMTNKAMGYHKIVSVTAAHRFTSAFLSSAHGSGVYGQVVLQHLYNMGTFDLTSFALVSQYIEQLEMLFATRLTFTFHESDRVLSFYNSFTRKERVLLDCMIERTEQDLMKDRYVKTWIERYALAEAMTMLSHIRGKFASLPGAGGGIALNAGELIALAQSYRDELLIQLEDFVVDLPEEVGMGGTFILG